LEEDMTEFLGTGGGQIAGEVTGLTAAAEQVVAARPELVWDLVADVTGVGGWSPAPAQGSAHPALADGAAARLFEWHVGTLLRRSEGATPPRRRAWPSR
jgi:hypothetical protein